MKKYEGSLESLSITALTNGKSAIFTNSQGKQYYASRRVANDILAAKQQGKEIEVYYESVLAPGLHPADDVKPWQRLPWLCTPSRF